MRIATVAVAVGLAFAGCAPRDPTYREYSDEVTDVALIKPSGDVKDAAPAASAPAADAEGTSTAPRVAAGPPMLAYSYRFELGLPDKSVAELMGRHEQACTKAGHTTCQVVSSSIRQVREGVVRGELSLRAAPNWLTLFRANLSGDAKSAGGRVANTAVESEDLSREIVDTEAQLRAKTTLRDRLQALLASRPGKLSELLEVERELARVQGELDSTASQLAVMRGRVATSEVTIAYTSFGALQSNGGLTPLTRAVRNSGDMLAVSLALLIQLLIYSLPWLAAGTGLVVLIRRLRPGWRGPFARKPPPPAA